jgi:hypothetical protein
MNFLRTHLCCNIDFVEDFVKVICSRSVPFSSSKAFSTDTLFARRLRSINGDFYLCRCFCFPENNGILETLDLFMVLVEIVSYIIVCSQSSRPISSKSIACLEDVHNEWITYDNSVASSVNVDPVVLY